MKRLVGPLLCLLALAAVAPGLSAQSPPSAPIRVVIAFPPGAAHDMLGRSIVAEFGKGYAPGSIAENKPGGGTVIATSDVARATPDGRTLLMVGFPFPLINSMHTQSKIDVLRDFVPVVNVMQAPNALIVRADSPFKSLQQLLAHAKANPGVVKYASVGDGSSPHLGMELLKQRAGVDITMVPYKGSAPALTDLMGGHVDVMFDNLPNVVPRLQNGQLRALAITSAARSSTVPDVPTMAEGGVADYVMNIWFGVAAPAGTPPATVAALNAEINRMIGRPDFSERFTRGGLEMVGGTPDAFGKVIAQDVALWSKVLDALGLKQK
ncbi:MAG: Bug family tripartite tricarboxylate transporter substrate binding protein [Lautropia sp.]